jgi:hypothetical protein
LFVGLLFPDIGRWFGAQTAFPFIAVSLPVVIGSILAVLDYWIHRPEAVVGLSRRKSMENYIRR